ncbi:MAG: amino acid ABC transporter substrate-binding protein [Candidatus Obscuribacter sp.]|nr:amino acid ABC transporter substrate-binding protein [Candidatus Obscuribacter sp.]MBK9277450.1 amino acid ABC transporter substrate-binding protein [Candidatus Obscuribacter sp.]
MRKAGATAAVLLLTLSFMVPAVRAQGVYDRVMRTGKLKAAYAVYPPFLMRDANTKKFSGIGYDVLSLVASRLGLQLVITEEVSWGTMIEGLRSNRYDIIACPVWANAKRARMADFTHPLCYSGLFAYTKYGDKRLDAALKDLNSPKFRIAALDGEMAEMIAKSDYPNAKKLSLPQMADVSDMLLSVSTGKADLAFVEPVVAQNFLKHNPKSIQNITPDKPVRVFPNGFMFNAGEERLKAMLNIAIDEMSNSGELDRILNKYEPFPKAYLRIARPYQR